MRASRFQALVLSLSKLSGWFSTRTHNFLVESVEFTAMNPRSEEVGKKTKGRFS